MLYAVNLINKEFGRKRRDYKATSLEQVLVDEEIHLILFDNDSHR